MTKIILLDIDGVLMHPGGYRAALRATVNHLIEPPLYIPKEGSPAPWFIPEFSLIPGQYPAETAMQAGCFASIPDGLRKNLLTETRNIYKSCTMRVFQQFTLGSENFTKTYNLRADFETESVLLTFDRANINEDIRGKLLQPNHHLAVLTSRPSLPPREVAGSALGFAPEAELALELIGLSNIPLMAFGKLEYLASQYGLEPAALVKPSPFQSLAAVLAAWTGEEWPSLQAANQWRETGQLNGSFDRLPKTFELIVVEDTMGGIFSARSAGEILKKAGFDVSVRAIGLTSGNTAKASAFRDASVQYFQDWESLIEEVGL